MMLMDALVTLSHEWIALMSEGRCTRESMRRALDEEGIRFLFAAKSLRQAKRVVENSVKLAKKETNMTYDPVNNPQHYTAHPSGVECITITRHMNFNIGNAVKYLWRAGLNGATLEDLKKAVWYINDEIARIEKEQQDTEQTAFNFSTTPNARAVCKRYETREYDPFADQCRSMNGN